MLTALTQMLHSRNQKLGNLIDAFAPSTGTPPTALWPFVKWVLRGAWPMVILAALIAAVAGFAEMTAAWLLGWVIDAVSLTGARAIDAPEVMAALIALAIFFLILRPIIFAASSYSVSAIVGPGVFALTLARLYRWTMGQSLDFFEDDFAGRIAQKQMQTARAITDVVTETINVVCFALASLLGATVLLSAVHPSLMAVLAIWLVLYAALLKWFLPRVRKISTARAGARAHVSGQVVDSLTNIKTVKLFAQSAHEDRTALDAMKGFREKSLRFGQLSAGFRFSLMLAAGVLPVALIGGTVLIWSQGGASAGDVAAAGAVSIRIAQMTGWVSFALLALYANLGEAEDGVRTLAVSVRLPEAADAPALRVAGGTVGFEQVSFRYGRTQGGVGPVTLHVQPGEKIGLVGMSGAGKTSLVSLLLRLYDPEHGRILIDGQDIRQVRQESLRAAITLVTQEPALFNRSARDNILYGRPDADQAALDHAIRLSHASFIHDLEDSHGRRGLDAHLGERGVKLSGGQRQRIALARAILKDAPILVLDEATSALDSEVEAEIQDALSHVMAGKTVIAIAHRLSTLAEMDRIIVLEDGQIAEDGPHERLLRDAGRYAQFWERQSGGFIDAAAQ